METLGGGEGRGGPLFPALSPLPLLSPSPCHYHHIYFNININTTLSKPYNYLKHPYKSHYYKYHPFPTNSNPNPTNTMILLLSSCIFLFSLSTASPFPNSSLPHPDPDSVARDVNRLVELSRRRALDEQCLTGNPIDDCWRCTGTDWRADRQRLADCGIGFGRAAAGGKGGPIYVVTDSSDRDAVNPAPGTLRYGVIQDGPLWITFASSMTIHLSQELLVNNFKTLDGRGADVHIAGGACITLQYVSNIIIHGLHIHNCVPTGNAMVRSSPTHYGYRTIADGDGISIFTGRSIWIDHCDLSYCADGLIDIIMGSTAITISNSFFSHHDEVMLMGHIDSYVPDSGMQVTIAFNKFGQALVQRMPRCRRGYFHVVNNDYTEWEMYAIGGSAGPTINSQGNRYIAPADSNAKEVTKRVETAEAVWSGWNWRTEGDVMVNGAFFVPSGEGLDEKYEKAESMEARTAAMVDQLTANAGVLGGTRSGGSGSIIGGGGGGIVGGGGGGGVNYGGPGSPGMAYGSGGGTSTGVGGGGGYGYIGMIYGSGTMRATQQPSVLLCGLMIFTVLCLVCFHSL